MRRFYLKKIIFFLFSCVLFVPCVFAAEDKVVFLISEQNISGPQRAWWASEIDLSSVEVTLVKEVIKEGYFVLEPQELNKVIQKDPAFRKLGLSEEEAVKIGNLSKADYIIFGKAIASEGAQLPHSSMRSYFANLSVKVIRIKDAKTIAYLDASGRSAHLDGVSGGREALVSAAQDMAPKISGALNKDKEGEKSK